MNYISGVLTNKLIRISVAAILALVGFFILTNSYSVKAADGSIERLVTIHDGKKKKVIVTKANTVGGALKQAGVNPRQVDIVDPKVDTKLIAGAYQVNIYRAQPVQVIDGQTRLNVMTPYDTPKQIAQAAGITLYEEDDTQLIRSKDILESSGAGLTLSIKRAPSFTLILYGESIEARSTETTVGRMLSSKRIVLTKNDTVSVPLTTPISENMKIEIWRNGKQTVNEEQAVAFGTEQIRDATQPVGYRAIKTAGVTGKKVVTFEIEMRNGIEVARKEIQSIQVLPPQAQVEIIGTKPTFSGSFAEALARLRQCEAGGAYNINSGNGYYGAYQYDVSTWAGYGGYTYASDAPAGVQDQKVWETYQRRGWRPWPSCGSSLPDSFR